MAGTANTNRGSRLAATMNDFMIADDSVLVVCTDQIGTVSEDLLSKVGRSQDRNFLCSVAEPTCSA